MLLARNVAQAIADRGELFASSVAYTAGMRMPGFAQYEKAMRDQFESAALSVTLTVNDETTTTPKEK